MKPLLSRAFPLALLTYALLPPPPTTAAQGITDHGSIGRRGSDARLRSACAGFVDEHLAIDRYLSERYDAPASATADLVAALAGVPVECVEEMIRSGRRVEAPSPYAKGVIHELSIDCDHINYSSKYYLWVPAGYTEGTPTPLVAIGHGGNSSMSQASANSTARSYLARYLAYAGAPLNAILVAPATTNGWGPAGYSLLLSTISKTKSEFTIDPDAVYVSGQSMGGHLAFRVGYLFADRWGAIAPQSGGYTSWTTDGTLSNLLNLPGYSTWGETELYGLDLTNEAIATWLDDHNFGWTTTEVPGSHPIDPASQPLIAQFFADHPRDLYPCATHLHMAGPMKLDRFWAGTPAFTIYPGREFRWNTRHWLEVEPFGDDTTKLSIHADAIGNTVRITSNNVRGLSVYLHPDLFDLAAPITVIVNGDTLFSDVVPVDLGLLLETVREYDDRGRIFYGKVDIAVTTDAPVAEPDGRDSCHVAHALLRTAATAIAPVTPPLDALLPLEPVRDLYIPDFASGRIDPDSGIMPLVFYGLDTDVSTLRMVKTGAGEVQIRY